MDRIKRWAKGLLILLGAWLTGMSELPQGELIFPQAEPDQDEDG
jgi:hypothetical protein